MKFVVSDLYGRGFRCRWQFLGEGREFYKRLFCNRKGFWFAVHPPDLFLPVFIGIIFEVVLLTPLTNRETALEPLAKDHPPFLMAVMYIH